MGPGPDHEPAAPLSRSHEVVRRAVRTVSLVVPAGEVEHRDLDPVVAALDPQVVPVRTVVRVIEPLEEGGRHARERRVRAERKVTQPGLAVRRPGLLGLRVRARAGQAQTAPHVRCDAAVEPREPRQVERTAEVDEAAAARERHRRRHRLELRRRLDGRQPLDGGRIGEPGESHLPVAVRQPRHPRDRVVAVLAFLAVRIEDAVRAVAPAHVLEHDHVAGASGTDGEAVVAPLPGLPVGRPHQERGQAARAIRPQHVGAQHDAVAHAHLEVPLEAQGVGRRGGRSERETHGERRLSALVHGETVILIGGVLSFDAARARPRGRRPRAD